MPLYGNPVVANMALRPGLCSYVALKSATIQQVCAKIATDANEKAPERDCTRVLPDPGLKRTFSGSG